MKLYLITATSTDTAKAPHSSWVGSQAEAASMRKRLNPEFRRAEITTSEVDVPTDKQGLIQFLNALAAGPTVAAAHAKLTAQ